MTPVDWDLIFSAFVDPAPVAANDSYSTVRDEPLRVAAPGLLANDSDFDADAITAAEVTDPPHGDAHVRADGSFAYFPDEGYVGTDSFTYKARDARAGADAATVETAVRDVTGPAVTPGSPRPGSTTRDTTPAIKATVTDDVTDLQEADVTLHLNGSQVPDARWGYDAATGLLTYNAPRLSRGTKLTPSLQPSPSPATSSEYCSQNTALVADNRKELYRRTPLWYYVLKEPVVQGEGEHLGEVGSRIVGEVFVGLLEGDLSSFLSRQPDWTPELPAKESDNFQMADLLRFVGEINPIG